MKDRETIRHCQFPPDLAALIAGPWIVLIMLLAVTLPGMLLSKALGLPANPTAYLWCDAALLGALGIATLFAARLPLYRRKQFLRFGPKGLDARHRALYKRAYACLAASVLLLVASFAML